MSVIWKYLFLLGYVTAVGPPRSLYLKYREDLSQGELSKQPHAIFLAIELAGRLLSLMLIAVVVEEQLGKSAYEALRLETAFTIVGSAGILHTAAYFVFVVLPKRGDNRVSYSLYRVFRNIAYACIPGLFLVLISIVWERVNGLEPYESGIAHDLYIYSVVLLVAVGFVEAVIVSRHPSAVDSRYK